MGWLGRGTSIVRRRALRLFVDRGAVVDPTPWRELDEWGLDAPDRLGYAPAGGRLLARALRGERITSDHVFVDLGAGLGRVVVQAARRPFGRVIGVELAPELLSGARANVEAQLDDPQRAKVELVEGDAAAWPVPPDLSHVFFNTPFGGEPLRRVLDRLVASVREHPRRLLLIVANARAADAAVVRAHAPFRVVGELPGRGPNREADHTILLRLDPEDGGAGGEGDGR